MNYVRKICTVNINAIAIESKKILLKEFILRNDLDAVLLQEVSFNDFSFLPSHHAIVNRSEQNVGTALLIRKTIPFDQIMMDPCGRIISVVVDGLNLVNIYGHSGSQYNAERDDLFQNMISPHLCKGNLLVLGGDFNCILDGPDMKSNNKVYCKGLRNLVSLFKLVDLGSASRQFTFLRHNSASRLDRFYCDKEFIHRAKKYETLPVPFSDHHAVVLTFEINIQNAVPIIGRGHWKINDFLLKDEATSEGFIQVMSELKQRRKHELNFSEWWSYDFKSKAKQYYKNKAFDFNQANARKKAKHYSELNKLIEQQAEGLNVQPRMSMVKSAIVEVEEQRLSSFRSKVQPSTMLENEKLSIYQVSKLVKRGFNTPVMKLHSPDGLSTKQLVQDHFEKQFRKPSIQQAEYAALRHIGKVLPRDLGNNLVEPISEEELRRTIESATKKKTPGPDGLTYEFYEKHFDSLKYDLLRLFNGFLDGSIPPQENFAKGIIILIPKSGDQNDLQNYRPISLLNTDYKILVKICATRLKVCMESLVGDGQTAGLEGKSCVQNLDKIRTVVARTQQGKRVKIALVSVDLQKAFDSVDHDRLWETLAKFGIPTQFITLIRRLYADASSQVMVNGFLTSSMKIQRSVRQGCPLSMLLFSLYVEPLIRQLHDSTLGLMIEGNWIKIMAYADDLTLIVRNDYEFDLVMSILKDFALQAAISINFEKSGYIRFNNCKLGPQMIQEKQQIKILGVIFKDKWKDMIKCNFDKLLNSFAATCQLHSARKINLLERNTILNSFLLSKLWYVSHILPPDNAHLAAIKKKSGYFLWNSHFFKVNRNQLYLEYSKGGLKLIDPENQCKALFIRSLLFESGKKIKHFLLNQGNQNMLSLNGKKWIQEAKKLANHDCIESNKCLYDFFINEMQIVPNIQEKYPHFWWDCIWENINQNFLSSNARSVLYLIFNDVIPNKVKMYNYTDKVDNNICEICNKPDTNIHRIKQCRDSGIVWNWIGNIIRKNLKIKLRSPEEILYYGISKKGYRKKAALFIVAEAMAYNVVHYKNPSLYSFQKIIRDYRWNNRKAFMSNFKTYLNIC